MKVPIASWSSLIWLRDGNFTNPKDKTLAPITNLTEDQEKLISKRAGKKVGGCGVMGVQNGFPETLESVP